MKFTPRIHNALIFAAKIHNGQKRHGGAPTISHLTAVAWIVSQYTGEEDMIIAAFLHDATEDTAIKINEIESRFGSRVGQILSAEEDKTFGLNKKEKIDSWADRKQNYLNRIAQASTDSLILIAADKIHGLMTIRSLYQDQGSNLWSDFNAPSPQKFLWVYEKTTKIISEKLSGRIVRDLESQLNKTRSLILDAPDTLP